MIYKIKHPDLHVLATNAQLRSKKNWMTSKSYYQVLDYGCEIRNGNEYSVRITEVLLLSIGSKPGLHPLCYGPGIWYLVLGISMVLLNRMISITPTSDLFIRRGPAAQDYPFFIDFLASALLTSNV